jgi:DNA-binding transcriptional ArsR family regulator
MDGCDFPSARGGLDAIALGEASPAQAREALEAALGGAPESACTALRAFVWKALDRRRRDTELRDWYDLLRRVEGRLAAAGSPLAERVRVLGELIEESMAVAARLPVEQLTRRLHVEALLRLLAAEPPAGVERARLGEALGLAQANLTRVLNLVLAGGLVERVPHGKAAIIRLTPEGRTVAQRLAVDVPVAA